MVTRNLRTFLSASVSATSVECSTCVRCPRSPTTSRAFHGSVHTRPHGSSQDVRRPLSPLLSSAMRCDGSIWMFVGTTLPPASRSLRRRLGSVRGLAKVDRSQSRRPSPPASGTAPSERQQFQEDCQVIESCNAIINARLDVSAMTSALPPPVTRITSSSIRARLAELDILVSDPKLYDNSAEAAKIVKEKSRVDATLATVERLTSELHPWKGMYEMALAEGDEEVVAESIGKVAALRKEGERARAETLLSLGGELSSCSCYLELQAGAGGTESHDWTSILLKMYTRWAEARGFTVRPLNSSPGDEAGLRSVMVMVEGDSSYGWLRTEAGVHRLVRNSPYDPAGRRHTSFSQVRVYPEADGGPAGAQEIDIATSDLRIETMRAQGAGGQHVNTTDSAVRITHLPTGLVALSQSDRSQHKNKETAMRALRAKIFQQQEEKRVAQRNSYASGLGDNAFGNQIRSYVLSPYQMVKDHRTGKQEGDVAGVLDGGLDAFIDAALVAEHTQGSPEAP